MTVDTLMNELLAAKVSPTLVVKIAMYLKGLESRLWQLEHPHG